MNWSNALKAGSLVIAIGGGALSFFVNLKTDVAVLQTDMSNVETSVSEIKAQTTDTARKVDRLYDTFIAVPLVANEAN